VEHYTGVACWAAALHTAQHGAAAARLLDRSAAGVALAVEWAVEVSCACRLLTMCRVWAGDRFTARQAISCFQRVASMSTLLVCMTLLEYSVLLNDAQ